MIQDIKTIISDTLLSWAISISPKGRRERLARNLVEFLDNELYLNETLTPKE
jgi:hypothetical protein